MQRSDFPDWIKLPANVWAMILTYTYINDIYSFSRCSKKTNDIAKKDMIWKSLLLREGMENDLEEHLKSKNTNIKTIKELYFYLMSPFNLFKNSEYQIIRGSPHKCILGWAVNENSFVIFTGFFFIIFFFNFLFIFYLFFIQ